MADISKIQTNGNTYDVKDATARESAQGAQYTAEVAQTTANDAQGMAETANAKITYGTCTTAADNDEKDVTITDEFSYNVGAILAVYFQNGNTVEEIDIALGRGSNERAYGDARCPAGGVVFFVYYGSRILYVDGALTQANSKVSSVNIGTVTTGDEPSVTNSGSDKDVVMDFVFPQGDSRIVSGTADEGESVTIEGQLVVFYGDDSEDGLWATVCNRALTRDIFSNQSGWSVAKSGNQFTFTADDNGSRYLAIVVS